MQNIRRLKKIEEKPKSETKKAKTKKRDRTIEATEANETSETKRSEGDRCVSRIAADAQISERVSLNNKGNGGQ